MESVEEGPGVEPLDLNLTRPAAPFTPESTIGPSESNFTTVYPTSAGLIPMSSAANKAVIDRASRQWEQLLFNMSLMSHIAIERGNRFT